MYFLGMYRDSAKPLSKERIHSIIITSERSCSSNKSLWVAENHKVKHVSPACESRGESDVLERTAWVTIAVHEVYGGQWTRTTEQRTRSRDSGYLGGVI